MREIDVGKLEDADRRPNLRAFIEGKRGRAYLLSGNPHRQEDEAWGRKGLLLYIETPTGNFYTVDTAGSGDKPDKLLAFVAYENDIPGRGDDAGKYVQIPKDRLGRHKRELTEKEKQQVAEWRKGGRGVRKSINAIADLLHVNNRAIMEYARTLQE